jgi:hypothetical protein
MTKNPTPVLLDRLSHVLVRQGFKLKRQQLLETAAYAFGCRSSDEFSAAAKSGEINPPPVVPLGRVTLPNGESLIIVTDPLANSAYGIDEAFIEQTADERRESIGVTPYGHLVRIGELADAIIPHIGSEGSQPVVGDHSSAMARSIREAMERLDGYTAEDNEADYVGQAENALSRALALAESGAVSGALVELASAVELIDFVPGDDAERHVEWTRSTIAEAVLHATSGMDAAKDPNPALYSILKDVLVHVDEEIENRKHGGDHTTWLEMQRLSTKGHTALRRLDKLVVHHEDDPDSIRISRDDLEQVLGAAESWAEDVTSGLADGTYDQDAGVEDVKASIDTLRIRLGMKPVGARVTTGTKPGKGMMTIHVATITHRHGEDVKVALSEAGLEKEIASYCRECWDEVSDYKGVPANVDGMTDEEINSTYFDAMSANEGGQYIDRSEQEVELPAAVVRAVDHAQCVRCDSGLVFGMCSDETCPFHNVPQDDPRGWAGHPQRDPNPKDDGAPVQAEARAGSYLATRPADWADQIATALEEGAAADIWYDAHDHGTDDPADTDRIAEGEINETQSAMIEAARILRELKPTRLPDGALMIDGIIPSVSRIESRAKAVESLQPIWMTNRDGEDTGQVTLTMLHQARTSYRYENGEFHPLTDAEREYACEGEMLNFHRHNTVQMGYTAFWEGRKWVAPEVDFGWDTGQEWLDNGALALERAKRYMEDIREDVERAGGQLHLFTDATDSSHELTILIPFDLVLESESVDDWKAALSYLLLTADEKKASDRVTCEFTAQRMVGKMTFSADPRGDTVWDATFDALRWGADRAVAVLDGSADPDDYAFSPFAPRWVRDWTDENPFEVAPIGLEKALRIVR